MLVALFASPKREETGFASFALDLGLISFLRSLARCLLISQDGDELYITKAYALDKYIAIVRDRDRNAITKNDFLKIRQWGAWKIDKREDVEDFARLVLAIALQSSAEN